MALEPLSKYIGIFGNLHRYQHPKWGGAPHKPILLLAVLNEVERGNITANLIELTPELASEFSIYWSLLVPKDTFLDKIANPFRFMVQEGFWELRKNGVPVSTRSLGDNPSIRQMRTEVDGAVLAAELWHLLQDRTAICALRTFLLKNYFGIETADVQPVIPAASLDYQLEKLKNEAQGSFRPKRVREMPDSAGYFVRHSQFPRLVKLLYNDACAVCGLNVRTDEDNGLVDAAHIMPFSIYHNDDPRNGIAFCKNHHWGFDAGWFTASDEYKIVISPHLQNALPYLTAGVSLLLPAQVQYAPAPDALAWHRTNKFKK